MKLIEEMTQEEIANHALDLFNSGKVNSTQADTNHAEACRDLAIARKHQGNDREYWINRHTKEAYLYKILKSLTKKR